MNIGVSPSLVFLELRQNTTNFIQLVFLSDNIPYIIGGDVRTGGIVVRACCGHKKVKKRRCRLYSLFISEAYEQRQEQHQMPWCGRKDKEEFRRENTRNKK